MGLKPNKKDDPVYNDWEFVFVLLEMSDSALQEMLEHYGEAHAMLTAIWEARCKSRAKHKRFLALWNTLEGETPNEGPAPGTKAHLVWHYLLSKESAQPGEIATAIGLTKQNVQSVLATRKEFHYDEDGWHLANLKTTQTSISIQTTAERSIATTVPIQEETNEKDLEGMRTRIHDHLCEVGLQKPALIAAGLGLSLNVVERLITHKWFKATPDGIAIAYEDKHD